jgi:predicted phage baseplate assembly protein
VALEAPNLDDRRFQDLVDDAKRLVQRRCPEWTDHNVSDPGVTLIETFAYMVDQLLYRLNRVPDRNYVKFLELIGLRLFPPTAARVDVTFWLSAPQPDVVMIPVGTEVATPRTETDEPVVFTVAEERPIIPCELSRVASSGPSGPVHDHTATLQQLNAQFFCFQQVPQPGDVLLVGLSAAVPACVVLLRFDCEIEGVGVDPRNPPLIWEAWDGDSWERCALERDETGGLNRAGDVIIHVVRGHTASLVGKQRAGWIRCRILPHEDGRPDYSDSPKITSLSACTIGGTAACVHAEIVSDEILGLSEGVPGQRFSISRRPVVPGKEPRALEVATGQGWDSWTEVTDFADSEPDDRHFVLDAVAGEVLLGPAVREPDGTLRQFGAVPPRGTPLRLANYYTGGGPRGNVAAGTVNVLRSSIPYVDRVANRFRAAGGVEGEDVENAKLRGPILMRTRNRAVTVEDYEQLAREAAPEVARVRCVPAGEADTAPGSVRVLVVPAVAGELGRLRFEQLLPDAETLARIADYLDERRVIGARVVVEPPVYQGVTVVTRLRARPRVRKSRLQAAALEALFSYFHPLLGGPDKEGWPFGRPVHVGEVYAVLQRLQGTEFVEEALLFAADPITGDRGPAMQRIDIGRHALVFSFDHQVRIE